MYGLSRSGIKASQAPETRRAVSARGVFVRRRRHAMFWPLPTGMPTAAGRRCPEQSTCRVVCVAHFDLKNDKLGAYIHLKRYSHEDVKIKIKLTASRRAGLARTHTHTHHTRSNGSFSFHNGFTVSRPRCLRTSATTVIPGLFISIGVLALPPWV